MITIIQYAEGALRELPYTGVESIPTDGWFWLDAPTADQGLVNEIGTALGFDILSIEDVASDMLPKLDPYEDHHYLVCHGLSFDEDRIGTVEFDMFISSRALVTFHTSEVSGIRWVRERMDSIIARGVDSPAQLAALILEAESRRFPALLDALDARVEELEDRSMVADSSVIGEAQALRRDVIVLRRVFGPQRDVLLRLSTEEVWGQPARRAFADVYDHHFRLVESLDTARALIGSIQETHRGALAARTNEVMKVLTVFSAIMLPLTLLAGIWGMNVQLPFADSPHAFRVVVGVMVGFAFVLWVYFVWRGFVGGGRLGRIPKAVGLTLSHLSIPGVSRWSPDEASERGTSDQVKP